MQKGCSTFDWKCLFSKKGHGMDPASLLKGRIKFMKMAAIIVYMVVMFFSMGASAKKGGEGNNTGCNGVGNPNSPCAPTTPPQSGNNSNGIGIGVGVGVGKADAEANVHNVNKVGVGVHNVNKVDNDNFNVNKNLNAQGQLQGQLQGQKQEAVSNSSANGNVNDNINYSSTGNVNGSNSQRQEANNEGVNTTVTGDTVKYEAADLSEAPGIPAAVYVDACSSAVSASAPGMGASFGQGNPVCLWVTLSNAALQQGDREKARLFLERAEDDLARQTAVTRWINWVPVVGRLF